jgi:hypothetical protein
MIMAQHLKAPRKVYKLISGVFDDNTGKEYAPGDEIVTNRNIEQDPNIQVEYIGLYDKQASCCGGKVYLEEEKRFDHLEVIHKGGGRYGVYNKLTGEKIHHDWLTKEEALQIEKANEEISL